MSKLTQNGLSVLERRYLKKNKDGKPIETPEDMFQRVAHTVASAEKKYFTTNPIGSDNLARKYENIFYQMMVNLDFLPNSPTLMNAGRPLGQLSACFVLPIEDSMDGIFGTLKDAAMIHKSGGGTGFSFSRIRPKNSYVSTTGGKASGPISFMHAYNAATGTVAQGGCFVGETLVMTMDGPVMIKNLKRGMYVLSQSLNSGVIWTPCTEPFLTKRDVSVVAVNFGGNSIICTPDHPFMVDVTNDEFVYKKAIELQPGDTVRGRLYITDEDDKLKFQNDNDRVVVSVVMQHATRDAWNVEIPETHNYAVCETMSNGKAYGCVFVSNTRRGANMGMLRVDHPDIMEFITIKNDLKELTNFNLSVAVTDEFMAAVKSNASYNLHDINTGEVVGVEDARTVYNAIVESAWKTGEPGMIFIDKVNANNFLQPLYGKVEACNPCLWGGTKLTINNDGQIQEYSIRELVEKEVRVWTGYEWSTVIPRKTGENQKSLIITTDLGRKVHCTLYHKFLMADATRKEAQNLCVGDELHSWVDPRTGEIISCHITAIEEGGVLDEVFCLYEPIRHTFMANGIVVGNCGEQPLLPYEACNLGSINLANFVKEPEAGVNGWTVDFERLATVTRYAVRFLDDVIDVNHYPLPAIERMVQATRKIGLGVMGFADLLQILRIPYGSEDGFALGEAIMRTIQDVAHNESEALARERQAYPAYYELQNQGINTGVPFRRNAFVTTIAPTGSISAIAGVSSGIEPLFSNVFYKHYMDDDYHQVVNERLVEALESEGLWMPEVEKEIMETGSVAHLADCPKWIKDVFACAHDITPAGHVMMQATFQKHVDNAISKTVNFANNASKDDIDRTYQMAYNLGCKGITVYRDQCRDTQVLNAGSKIKKAEDFKDNAAILDALNKLSDEEVRELMLQRAPNLLHDAPTPVDEFIGGEAFNYNGAPDDHYYIIKASEGDTNQLVELLREAIDMFAGNRGGIRERVNDLISQFAKAGLREYITGEDHDFFTNPNWKPGLWIERMNEIAPGFRERLMREVPLTKDELDSFVMNRLAFMEPADINKLLPKGLTLAWGTDCKASACSREIRRRPERLEGSTTQVKINCGKLYLTMNKDDNGKLFEVFSTTGKSGGCPAQSEAVCRLVSLCLRAGIPEDEIIRQIKGIKCMACLANRDIKVLSCPDAIARAMKTAMGTQPIPQEAPTKPKFRIKPESNLTFSPSENTVDLRSGTALDDPALKEIGEQMADRMSRMHMFQAGEKVIEDDPVDDREVCPQCGAEMKHIGGCKNCLQCGYSSCG